AHHGMLAVTGSPPWRTVTGGSRAYVERLAAQLPDVRTGTPVRAVHRTGSGVQVTDHRGGDEAYDAVVVATHPHQALQLLAAPRPLESALLGAISYTPNETVLHHDTRLLPSAGPAAASWNYRQDDCSGAADAVVLSYDMNRLQQLDGPDRWVVTLNATDRIRPADVVATMAYEHPLYTPESVAAQARLPELNDGVVAFAGAYFGWGFHEDGALSGLRAAESLGASW
ncbi:MAG: amine oxidase, partial [Frankiales bacterium]|nr:amine oxidase [Frankiales bacterium]